MELFVVFFDIKRVITENQIPRGVTGVPMETPTLLQQGSSESVRRKKEATAVGEMVSFLIRTALLHTQRLSQEGFIPGTYHSAPPASLI